MTEDGCPACLAMYKVKQDAEERLARARAAFYMTSYYVAKEMSKDA